MEESRTPTRRARDLMTPNPETVDPDASLVDPARRLKELDVGILPVVDRDGRLVGVITDRDIVVRAVAEGRDCRTTPVRDVLSRDIGTVHPDDDVQAVLRIMRERQVRRVPVVEGNGRLVGIVSQADLLVALEGRAQGDVARTLEEVSRPAEPPR